MSLTNLRPLREKKKFNWFYLLMGIILIIMGATYLISLIWA